MNNERVIELFHEFREAYVGLDSTTGRALLPNFEPLPPVMAMLFCSLLEAHPHDLTNGVNRFSEYIDQLRAWQQVISALNEHERAEAVLEFIHPLAHFCLGSPYTLKQQFCKSVTELSHQANRVTIDDWCDTDHEKDLKDSSNFKSAKLFAKNWSAWPNLHSKLAALNSADFKSSVYNFRNDSHHGFPRQIEVGLTLFVRREASHDEVSCSFGTFFRSESPTYTLGAYQPLLISDIVPALTQQHQAALEVHQAYIKLLKEQLGMVIDKCRVYG
jgi:hypothetical protein